MKHEKSIRMLCVMCEVRAGLLAYQKTRGDTDAAARVEAEMKDLRDSMDVLIADAKHNGPQDQDEA